MPDEAARQIGEAYVASTMFDVCKSPTAPVPYTILANLANSIRTEQSVRFTGNQAFHQMSRVSVVSGDEAGIGGGLKSQRNLGFCKPVEWSEHVRTKGNWLVMHSVRVEMNCFTPDSPGNTEGRLFYVVCTAAAAVTPTGEIEINSSDDAESQESDDESDSPSEESTDGGESDSQEGTGDEPSSRQSDSDQPDTGQPDTESESPSDGEGSDESGKLSEEQQEELDELRRQEAELEKEIDQLKDLAIEAAKALDPTPASDLYDLVMALRAGDVAGALVAAAFVLLSLSPWKLIKMGRGAFKLAKIMRKLSKLYDKLKALKKRIAKALKKLHADERGMIRISRSLREMYEAEVKALEKLAEKLKKAGKSNEEIANELHKRRRELGEKFKDLTPPDMLEKIHARNLEKYGDKLGPSIDYLRNQGKSWEDIIESASRPGGKDLGL